MSAVDGNWREIQLAGHAVELFEPANPNPHGFVVLYLHGVHGNRLSQNQVYSTLFARHGLRAICPMTGQSWWANRICREFDAELTAFRHVMENVVPEIERRWQARPPQIALLGTSMGGQGALRFAFKHPNTFPVVAALSPAIDYQQRVREGDETLTSMYGDPESARQDTATLHVHPLNWPRNIFFACDPTDNRWIDSADRLRMKLYSLGIPHECDLETEAGGHGFGYYNHQAEKAVRFILERLELERRRQES